MVAATLPAHTPPLPAAAGVEAERVAAAFLERRGHSIVARRVRLAGGEVDLITRSGAHVYFVEVRSRSRADFGDALESVDLRKRQRVSLAAAAWIARSGEASTTHLSVLAIDGRGRHRTVQFLPDAFDALPRPIAE